MQKSTSVYGGDYRNNNHINTKQTAAAAMYNTDYLFLSLIGHWKCTANRGGGGFIDSIIRKIM